MEETDTHGSTIFVSNLPYTATSVDIQTLFSDIAPVRSAFVVLDKGAKVSKGVAYVSFAIKEDAELAIGSETPLEIDGRVLRLQWADRKASNLGVLTHAEKPKVDKPKKTPRPRVAGDPDAIRTVVLANLPDGIDSKVLWKKARKVPGATEVIYPAPERDAYTAFVKFRSAAEALAAIPKLHNHIFKGSRISAVLKKRVDSLVVGRKSGAPSRSSRLIIRNLPWHITEQDLHNLFAPYGPIYSVTLPTAPAPTTDDTTDTKESKPSRLRGFAFVWMISHADAEKAIKGVNGRVVGAKGKAKLTRKERLERARERAAARLKVMKGGEGGEEQDESEESEGEEEKGKEGRVVAVDWALSKDKWQEAVSKRAEEDMDVDEVEVKDESEEEEESEEESSDGSGEDEEEDEDGEPHERPQLPDVDIGTTLFVRNVPFEATEEDLRTLFRAFGPLRYARITIDKDTGRSRGTGFVCFWKKEHADEAIEEAEAMARELGANATPLGNKPNPFTMSLLTLDPSASLVKRLVLHGRTLSVTRAVARDEADRLREEGERSREKLDKRNLYLMREGVIFPNSSAAAGLSATELAARQASFDSRKTLLRSNPSLYVSRTRISVRRIPLWASERVLKRLAVHAVKEFEAEVERGERESLTRDELHRLPDEGEEEPKKTKVSKKGRPTGVRQSKIVRAADRIDSLTGKGRSRGYGFIETEEHADALRVLRWVNNRPGVGALMRGWWREEVKDLVAGIQAEIKEGREDAKGDRDAKLKRLKEELEKLEAKGEGDEGKGTNKTLILEFAIENVQVVKRRKERSDGSNSKPSIKFDGNKKRKSETEDETPAPKKRRKELKAPSSRDPKEKPKSSEKPVVKAGTPVAKDESNLGGIIGRKRREKRKGK
ncbi:RNA-binding domain-containing protein [Ceratobasidium sp. AG-I]|nr:RNA-binding domain-containing protein [Ceratobasidium sp. AG-I]